MIHLWTFITETRHRVNWTASQNCQICRLYLTQCHQFWYISIGYSNYWKKPKTVIDNIRESNRTYFLLSLQLFCAAMFSLKQCFKLGFVCFFHLCTLSPSLLHKNQSVIIISTIITFVLSTVAWLGLRKYEQPAQCRNCQLFFLE